MSFEENDKEEHDKKKKKKPDEDEFEDYWYRSTHDEGDKSED